VASVRDLDVDVRLILLTHAHIDHITGVARMKDEYSAPVYLHKDDLFLYEGAVEQGEMFGFKVRQPPPVDTYYDGTPVTFGDYVVQVHHTPGHCPGGVCLQIGRTGTAFRSSARRIRSRLPKRRWRRGSRRSGRTGW